MYHNLNMWLTLYCTLIIIKLGMYIISCVCLFYISIATFHASVTLIKYIPFFQKTKFIIKFVTSIIVKMQSFDEMGQILAKM